MTFKTNVEIAKGRIEIAPMVNIVFLLLIFLLLSSPLVSQTGIRSAPALPFGPADTVTLQELVLTVSRDNLLFVNNGPTTLEKLPEQLRRTTRDMYRPKLIIKADGQVEYQTLVKITGIAFDCGITAVNLATRPEVPVIPKK